ncbi:hypothetical protein [Rhodohalobacter sp.]|uniref:hypothetical protein n=1 Tax=Rhodohalobacter sp. TaxID=1974210 RepID=UPI002ACD2574|nr:hypothetical protein [Rhodohalobacter sp.]MDZ7756941.1 hypothetical protein [Rhodohalobacter sp.]
MEKRSSKSLNSIDEDHSREEDASVKELLSTEKYPNTDFIDRLLRVGLTVVTAGFTSGVIAGLIQDITEFDLSFGSPVSLGFFVVFLISFWILFSNIGPFKNK